MSTKRRRGLVVDLDCVPAEELAAARIEDSVVAAVLGQARVEHQAPSGPACSAQQNKEFMEKMREGSKRVLARRIKNRDVIPKDELIVALGGKKRWVNEALRAGRLFTLSGPAGSEYFPAFFADDRYDRRALGRVVQALAGMPGESKLYFFTRKSSRLGTTALEALLQGRTTEVVASALAFSVV